MSQFHLAEAQFLPEKSDSCFIAIRVKGTSTSGHPFEGVAFLEMDGRDAEWEGTQFGDEEFEELWEPLMENIYEEEYRKATAWWEALPPEAFQ